jgi:hypothetical protein
MQRIGYGALGTVQVVGGAISWIAAGATSELCVTIAGCVVPAALAYGGFTGVDEGATNLTKALWGNANEPTIGASLIKFEDNSFGGQLSIGVAEQTYINQQLYVAAIPTADMLFKLGPRALTSAAAWINAAKTPAAETAGAGASAGAGEAAAGAGEAIPQASVDPAAIDTLVANGVKITPANVVATGKTPSGQFVFLETGNSTSGLQHIIQRHAGEFANIGVSESEIPSVVMQAIREGNIVGYQGVGTGRPIYQITINGQPQKISITVGSNGYVVGANPAGKGVP